MSTSRAYHVSLYAPRELRERMKEYPYINWSKVFQQAAERAMTLADQFEEKLANPTVTERTDEVRVP